MLADGLYVMVSVTVCMRKVAAGCCGRTRRPIAVAFGVHRWIEARSRGGEQIRGRAEPGGAELSPARRRGTTILGIAPHANPSP